jgi:hypothetical protein
LALKLADPIGALQCNLKFFSMGGYFSGLSDPKNEIGRNESARRVKRIIVAIIN